MAAESTSTVPDGTVVYAKKCAICHGAHAEKSPIKNMNPIAGMNAKKVGSILLDYQNKVTKDTGRISHGYSQEMIEATVSLSRKDIDAIATYVSSFGH